MLLSKNLFLYISINFLIFSFSSAIFLVKGGHNFAPLFLSLIGFGYLIYAVVKQHRLSLSVAEKSWIGCLIFYCAVFLLSFFWHSEKIRELEHISKLCFFIPLLYLFAQYKPNVDWFLKGIVCGASIAGIVAIYDRFILNVYAAYSPRILQIQAGDIAMSLGLFSFAIGLYYFSCKQYRMMLFAIIATLLGIFGSILSTARGGWIGLPFLLCFVLFSYRQYLSKKIGLFLSVLFVLLITAMAITPKTKLVSRVTEAYTEVQQYFSPEEQQEKTSVGARLELWKSALLMVKEKPVLGLGSAGATQKRQLQNQEGIISEYAASFTHAHNQYLDNLSKLGFLGLTALLAVFFVPLYHFYQKRSVVDKTQHLVATLAVIHIISVMFYSLTQAFLTHNSGHIFYFFLIFIFYSLLKDKNQSLS